MDSDSLSEVGDASRAPSGHWHNRFFQPKKKFLQPKDLINWPTLIRYIKEFVSLCFILIYIMEIIKLGFDEFKSELWVLKEINSI